MEQEFGDTYALKGVTMSIKEGEVFAILGQNGAGKTTLVDRMAGKCEPSAGSVTMYGREVSALTNVVYPSIGYCQ